MNLYSNVYGCKYDRNRRCFLLNNGKVNHFYDVVPELLKRIKEVGIKKCFSAADGASNEFVNSSFWSDMSNALGISPTSVVKSLTNRDFSKMDVNRDEYIHGIADDEIDSETAVCYIFKKRIVWENKAWFLYVKIGVGMGQIPYLMSFHLDTKMHGDYSKTFSFWDTVIKSAKEY